MSLERLSSLKKRQSPLVMSGQQIFVSSVAGISTAMVSQVVTFQLTNLLCMSLLTCFAKA